MVWPRRAQSNVVGFILVVMIVLVTAGATYFWAFPLLQSSKDYSEIARVENKMFELHYAILAVAGQHTQKNIQFNLDKGTLALKNNLTINYRANMPLPEGVSSGEVILLGETIHTNDTVTVEDIGILGRDEPASITKKGTIEFELTYRILNDTDKSDQCYGIILSPKKNAAIGKGRHYIYIQWNNTETSNYLGCNTNWERILIEMD